MPILQKNEDIYFANPKVIIYVPIIHCSNVVGRANHTAVMNVVASFSGGAAKHVELSQQGKDDWERRMQRCPTLLE